MKELRFQLEAIKNINTYDTVGFDVLLRAGIPNYLLFSEYCSINPDLDEYILQKALETVCNSYSSEHIYLLKVSLALLVRSPEYLSKVPTNFFFDLNSNCFISNVDYIEALQKINKRIFIDGMALGHSNIDILRRIKPYGIKIDREILGTSDDDMKRYLETANNIAEIAIVKRIENHHELERIRSLGASYAHGYVFYEGESDV